MSVKNNSQRIFIIVIVVVFFLTSVAATGFVIYDSLASKDKKSANSSTDLQKQLDEAQNKPKEGALQGTKLSGFTPVASVAALEKIDTKPGEGAEAKPESTITAHYTGAVAATGEIFQSSKDTGEPFTSPLSGLIPGWQQGIPGMKAGGVRRLVIPADLAYGANPPPGSSIPPNAALVFDIELISIQ